MRRWLASTALALSACAEAGPTDAMSEVLAATCDLTTVFVGEDPNHGEGATITFKAALVEQLVGECGFEQVVFEASFYEFSDIARAVEAGEPLTEERLRTAVGGLWSDTAEFAPLVPVLVEGVNAGTLRVGGIHDQLPQRGQDYANDIMGGELMAVLPTERAEECTERLRRRIYSFLPENGPYDVEARSEVQRCIAEAEASLPEGSWERAMAGSLSRVVARDLKGRDAAIRGRSASMAANLAVWQPDAARKTIVWTATVHAARRDTELGNGTVAPNLGRIVEARAGEPAYILAFSALSGSTRMMDGTTPYVPTPSPGSLEATAFAGTEADAVFLDRDDLIELGTVPGAALAAREEVRAWHELVDGVVVFREQFPKTWMP